MADLQRQHVLRPDQAGVIAISDDVYHLFDAQELLLTNPGGAQLLYLRSEVGTWRAGLGDRTTATGTADMPAAAQPTADVLNGTGTVPIYEGESIVIPAPTNITVKSYTAGDILTFFWV